MDEYEKRYPVLTAFITDILGHAFSDTVHFQVVKNGTLKKQKRILAYVGGNKSIVASVDAELLIKQLEAFNRWYAGINRFVSERKNLIPEVLEAVSGDMG